MVNMSYCRFQNTLMALQECADNLFDGELSEEEERSRKRLVKLCAKIADEAEDYDDEDEAKEPSWRDYEMEDEGYGKA